MSSKLFLTILAVIVCTLIVLGVVNLSTDTSVDFYEYGLGREVKDFTGTFQQSIGLFNKIGDTGRDILNRIGTTQTRMHNLRIITYKDTNNNYSYIVYWRQEVLYGDINANGPITTTKYFYNKIYMFQDYNNSTRLNDLINNNGYKYIFTTERAKIYKNDNWKDLSVQRQAFQTVTEEYLTGNGSAYIFVSDEVFDFATMVNYNFIEA